MILKSIDGSIINNKTIIQIINSYTYEKDDDLFTIMYDNYKDDGDYYLNLLLHFKIIKYLKYLNYNSDYYINIIVKMFENYYDNLTQTERLVLNEKIKEGQKRSNYELGSSFRGKVHKEETKKIIGEKNSISQKGEKNSQFGTCWITNGVNNLKIKLNDLPLYPEWWKGRVIKK